MFTGALSLVRLKQRCKNLVEEILLRERRGIHVLVETFFLYILVIQNWKTIPNGDLWL